MGLDRSRDGHAWRFHPRRRGNLRERGPPEVGAGEEGGDEEQVNGLIATTVLREAAENGSDHRDGDCLRRYIICKWGKSEASGAALERVKRCLKRKEAEYAS